MSLRVELTGDTYYSCLSHALSTEREEVMGLLLGEMKEDTVHVCSLSMMRRLDKQPDRVEISPEQLSAAAIEAEVMGEQLKRSIQVVGWYHSHPHITVWPSHVDVRTQADYQVMSPNFIGLIFSCFQEIDKKSSIKVICFQSISKTLKPTDPVSYDYIQLPLTILPTPHGVITPICISAVIHLVNILMEEEKESYERNQKNCTDKLTLIHNGAVYSKAVIQMLQVIGAPLIQQLQELIQHNHSILESLNIQKKELEQEMANIDLV